MLKTLFEIFLYLFLLFVVFVVVSGFEFNIQFKPFKVHFLIRDWQEILIITAVILLFFTYGHITREKTKADFLKERTEITEEL